MWILDYKKNWRIGIPREGYNLEQRANKDVSSTIKSKFNNVLKVDIFAINVTY